MGWLSGIAGKVIVGVLSLAIVLTGISWWQADPAWRAAFVDSVGRVIGWILVVVAVPWIGFLVIGWIARKRSNAAGVALVGTLTLLEAVGLAWLFGFHVSGGAAWSMAIAAVLLAGVYNVFTCDWIAEKVEG